MPYQATDGKILKTQQEANAYSLAHGMGYHDYTPPGTAPTPLRSIPVPTQNQPAVITSQPAQQHLNQVNQNVTNWSNQMATQQGAGQQPSVVSAPGGKFQLSISGQPSTGQIFDSYQEAVNALNSQVNPGTANPNQAVLDKINKTLTPLEGEVLSPEEQLIRGKTSELDQLNALWDKTDTNFINQLQQFQNGTFPLSPEEQAQLTGLQNLWTRQIEQQKMANKNYEGAMVNIGIASGRNRYAPEIEQGNLQDVVQRA